MTQPTQTLDSFFGGGSGGRGISWRDQPIGTTVSGTITAVHEPVQQIDPVKNEPVFKKNGQPKMQVRVDLDTAWRNWEMTKRPDDPSEVDDGSRSLYIKGWMQGAIGDAMRKAGHQGAPQVGAKISVTLSEREPNDNPVLSPTNKFTATYEQPGSVATGEFFGAGGSASPAPAEAEPQRPAAISEAAWAQMPLEAKKSVAATMGGSDDGEPPF